MKNIGNKLSIFIQVKIKLNGCNIPILKSFSYLILQGFLCLT